MLSKVHSVAGFVNSLSPAWSELIQSALTENGVPYLHSLEDLKLIKELDCSRTEIEDLSPLRMLPYLEILDLSNTRIKDFTSIMYLANLKELNACFCYPFDLDILITLPHLKVLDISYPKLPFQKFDALSDLEQLQEGYFNACNIDTVAHFMTMSNIDILSLPFNPIPRDELDAFRDLTPDCKLIH